MRSRQRAAAWGAACLVGLAVLAAGAGLPLPGASASTAARRPVRISLEVPSRATQHERFVLTATLEHDEGAAVVGAPVEFARETLYGWLALGKATTDAQGIARLEVAERAVERLLLRATFAGTGGLAAAEATASVWVQRSARPTPPTALSAPIGLAEIELRTGMPVIWLLPRLPVVALALLVGSVWVTYAYVLALMAGVWTDGRKARPKEVRPRR